MSQLKIELRDGFQRLWENLTEEWHDLRAKAERALTRFRLPEKADDEPQEVEVARRGARWGVLAGEVEEDGDEVVIRLEVPGMEKDDFELEVVGNHLVVRGEKRLQRERKDGHYYLMERAYGRFERVLPLPAEVDSQKATATYRRGVLQVTLPKSADARARRIAIRST